MSFIDFITSAEEVFDVGQYCDGIYHGRGFVYNGRCTIRVDVDGDAQLIIGSEQWAGDKLSMEAILYVNWYLGECIEVEPEHIDTIIKDDITSLCRDGENTLTPYSNHMIARALISATSGLCELLDKNVMNCEQIVRAILDGTLQEAC